MITAEEMQENALYIFAGTARVAASGTECTNPIITINGEQKMSGCSPTGDGSRLTRFDENTEEFVTDTPNLGGLIVNVIEQIGYQGSSTSLRKNVTINKETVIAKILPL